jgi:hypothetical protein
MTEFQPRQTVYLPTGQEAEYVAMIDGQHAVRIIYDVDSNGYDEPPYSYPDDRVTITHQVFAKPPVERFDGQVLAMQAKRDELAREVAELRNEVSQIERNKKMQKAAEKYPEIQDALDFIEGRITHIVVQNTYGETTIQTMPEAFQDVDRWGGRSEVKGMKLLCLFGTDIHGKTLWGLNQYRDGSGSGWTTIWPARSELEARHRVQRLLDDALEVWRAGDAKAARDYTNIQQTLDANPWITVPADWTAHIAAIKEKARQQKIDKLRAELTALEAGVQPSQKNVEKYEHVWTPEKPLHREP